MEPVLINDRDAAAALGLSRTYLHLAILDKPGGIPRVKVGRRTFVHVHDLHAYAERLRQHAHATGRASPGDPNA